MYTASARKSKAGHKNRPAFLVLHRSRTGLFLHFVLRVDDVLILFLFAASASAGAGGGAIGLSFGAGPRAARAPARGGLGLVHLLRQLVTGLGQKLHLLLDHVAVVG